MVHSPTEEKESVRSLIRCRLAFKEAEKRVKQQINALLLAHDYQWPYSRWTNQHLRWLLELRLPHPCLHQVLEEYREHLGYLQNPNRALNEHIDEIACS